MQKIYRQAIDNVMAMSAIGFIKRDYTSCPWYVIVKREFTHKWSQLPYIEHNCLQCSYSLATWQKQPIVIPTYIAT